MEIIVKAAWLMLAAVHAAPAAAAFSPALLSRLYGLAPDGTLAVLLTHRGAMFLAVVAAALLAAFDPASRRAAAVVVAISLTGFLLAYGRAGFPDGALRSIALVDVAALVPLAIVLFDAARR